MVKKLTAVLGITALMTSFTACGQNAQTTPQAVIEQTAQTGANQEVSGTDRTKESVSGSNILVVYFTVLETDGADTVAGASRVVKDNEIYGNTQYIATEIQENLNADIFAIETKQSYPGTHNALLDYAYNEKSENARPELSTHIDNLDKYDYIIIGYPNWNADLPMPLYSFFEEYDFSGKTIIPFVTHGGSGFSDTIRTIKKLEPNANVVESGLSVSRNDVAGAQAQVQAWTDALIKK